MKPISALLVYKMTAFFLLGLVVLHSALSEVALWRLFSARSNFDMYGFIKNTDILTRLKAWVLEGFFFFNLLLLEAFSGLNTARNGNPCIIS